MSDGHTDCAFDLFGGGTHQGTKHGSTGNSSMDDVIDFISLEAENFAESASDLIQAKHGSEGSLTIQIWVRLTGSDHHWVKVIMTEFSCPMGWIGCVIAEDCPIRIPLSNR